MQLFNCIQRIGNICDQIFFILKKHVTTNLLLMSPLPSCQRMALLSATVGTLTAAFRVEHRTFQRDESAAGTAVRHGGQQDAFGPGAEGIRFKIFFSALHGA